MQDTHYISSDEEVSTNKERHSRLGEDNLDDTLEYDFSGPALRPEKFKELQTKDSGLLANQDTCHDVEAKAEEAPDSMLRAESVPLTPVPVIQGCVLYCSSPSPTVIKLNATKIPGMKDSVDSLDDKA